MNRNRDESSVLPGADDGFAERLGQSLRDLPELQPETDAWQSLGVAVEARHRRRRRRYLTAAAAALVGVSMAALFFSARWQSERPTVVVDAAEPDRALGDLKSASRNLEALLQMPALSSRVLSPAEAARIVVLEDRIALIDLGLEDRVLDEAPDREVALWSDRVVLLDELVRARGRHSGGAGFRNANLIDEGRFR